MRPPNRHVLIPHKISFDDVFSDQSHMTIDIKIPLRSAISHTTSTMHLSDLNRNKRHLQDVEFVQLLTSLVIRAIQIHKKHERFIPGSFSTYTDSSTVFTDALTISQMQLHSSSLDQTNFYVQSKLPPIIRPRPSSAEMSRMKSDAQTRAKKTGVNLSKAREMSDALSNLLKTDREQSRSTFVPTNTPHDGTSLGGITSDYSEITHAWLLEQCK
jgi:hypothetical protein